MDETNKGRAMLCLVTYHYSKSDRHRGCAGFGYDTDKARTHTFNVVRQLDKCFGGRHGFVFPLVVGLETDEEALLFHGVEDKVLDLSTVSTMDDDGLARSLGQLYPDMPEHIAEDLLPLVKGNISHIAEIKHTDHSFNLDHHEWIICVGRGFDWLQMANLALIIGPYSPDLSEPIHTAATIIESNMRNGRIPDDGFLLLAEASYHDHGVDRTRAELESRFLADFAAHVIRDRHPDLAKKMHARSAIISWESRAIALIEN
jgi:Carboxysome Shell Carbonic Anhydrase